MKTITKDSAKKIVAEHGLSFTYHRNYKLFGKMGPGWVLAAKHGEGQRIIYGSSELADVTEEQFYDDCMHVACNSMSVEQMGKVVDCVKFKAAQDLLSRDPDARVPGFEQLAADALCSDKQVHTMETAIDVQLQELENLYGPYADHKAAHAEPAPRYRTGIAYEKKRGEYVARVINHFGMGGPYRIVALHRIVVGADSCIKSQSFYGNSCDLPALADKWLDDNDAEMIADAVKQLNARFLNTVHLKDGRRVVATSSGAYLFQREEQQFGLTATTPRVGDSWMQAKEAPQEELRGTPGFPQSSPSVLRAIVAKRVAEAEEAKTEPRLLEQLSDTQRLAVGLLVGVDTEGPTFRNYLRDVPALPEGFTLHDAVRAYLNARLSKLDEMTR